jgi:5-methylcytosine-specific restriction endonuclease McrA
VSGLNQKRPRLRLEQTAYAELRKQVLKRDRWRCRNCGSAENLQVHHMNLRSRLGDDCIENLITLCARCHERLHRIAGSRHAGLVV